MLVPKQYLHDRFLLLLGSVNAFLTLLLVVLILARLDTSHSSYIVQYRANVSVDAFRSGGSTELYSFVVFGVLVFVFHLLISFKVFLIHRQLAAVSLGLGTLLLLLAIIVSNALLVLR